MKKNKNIIILVFLYILSSLSIFGFISGFFGLVVLFSLFVIQSNIIKNELKFSEKKYRIGNFEYFSLNSEILLFIYYIISLSMLYYVTGILDMALFLWNTVNFFLLFYFTSIRIGLPDQFSYIEKIRNINYKNLFPRLVVALSGVVVLGYFFIIPEVNGSPTPWRGVSPVIFLLFYLITFYLLLGLFFKNKNKFTSFLYLILAVCLVAIKYIYSYGYDTLIHQAALQHILENGRILPLTPFYVGSYVMEVLVYKFTSIPLVLIERWFVPVMFVVLSLLLGSYLLKRINKEYYYNAIPLVVIFLLPNQFYYSTPYAFSLIWLIVAVGFLYLYVNHKEKQDLALAFFSSLAALFIHPFIGLSIIVWIFGVYFSEKATTIKRKKIFTYSTFFISSVVVLVAFAFYSLLTKNNFLLQNPFEYIKNFFNIFLDPVWYNRAFASLPLWLVYFYEKSYFVFIIFSIIYLSLTKNKTLKVNIFLLTSVFLWFLYFFNKLPFIFILITLFLYSILNNLKTKKNNILIIISFSYTISALLFMTVFYSSQLTIFDKINYSERLLQAAKWTLWPLVLSAIIVLIDRLRKKEFYKQIIFIICFSLLLTVNWYLTYPRQDSISNMNVNNIRGVDYDVIEFINSMEGGKDDYLVLSNMLFAGGAIQKYGFGPYYQTDQGELFYYSVPMSSDLHNKYTVLLSERNFRIDQVYSALENTGLNKAYLITTDYWDLFREARIEAEEQADNYWYFDNRVFVYTFSLNN